ncbi:MAG: sugar transferase [Pseudomonadota bacterium]
MKTRLRTLSYTPAPLRLPRLNSILPGRYPKRAFDIAFAASALLLLSPLMLTIIAIMRATDPGPILYGHERVGMGGRRFVCWKFRSMVPDAAVRLERLLRHDPVARAEWERDRKLRDDPRVTAIGAALRKSSLDELPQFYNVLMGEMSVVGPRPVVDDELARYGRHSRSYLSVRPGITGLWQVSGRNDVGYSRRVALDAYYVSIRSFWLDLGIIIRTVGVVFGRRGSY